MNVYFRKIFKYLLGSFVITLLFVNCGKPKTCKGIYRIGNITYKNEKSYNGKCVTHHPNFKIRSVQSYENGFDHGEWKFYHDNGEISTIGKFEYGKKIGVWKYYFPSGALKVLSEYNYSGDLIRQEKYDIKGNLIKNN